MIRAYGHTWERAGTDYRGVDLGNGRDRCPAWGWGMLDRFEAAAARRRVARRGVNMDARPHPAVETGVDCLPQIEHIVILMMENHSYDNYLGMLAGRGDGLPSGPEGTPDVVSYTPDGKGFRAHHLPSTTQVKNNPSQNWHASHIAFAGGRNDGFA